ncbi:DUF2188 domain-containing protein [Tautonia marina]|uniref:DUF2188 domain-containing protein n=1 Tax=Tautonia marina TaxID=2653855 RepID=UPI0012607930|nr:DUF2188 domain-containing protein [Tautonia marina]
MAKNLHVVPHEERWAIKQEGDDGIVSEYSTKEIAVEEGESLARDREVNLIIHRQDGVFDHVLNFTETNGQAGNGRERLDERRMTRTINDETIRLHDVTSVGSRVSWSALMAGAVVALTVYVSLGTLGVAVGLSTAGTDAVGGSTLAIGAAIWAAISLLVALFMGGFVTSRSTVGERKDEAMIYGLLLWGTIFVAVVVLTGLGLNLGVGGMLQQVTGPNVAPTLTEAQLVDAGLTNQQIADVQAAQAQSSNVRATTAAWWTFATLIASIIASIAGSLIGAGPQLSLEDLRRRRDAGLAVRPS